MDQRRFFAFFATFFVFLMLWQNFVVPRFAPPPVRAPVNAGGDPDAEGAPDEIGGDEPVVGGRDVPADEPPVDAVAGESPADAPVVPDEADEFVEPPVESVVLGTKTANSPFAMAVELSNRGAAIQRVLLNDPRYKELGENGDPLAVVGNLDSGEPATLATTVPELRDQFNGRDLDEIAWEIAEQDDEHAVFRLATPDGQWEITKAYRLHKRGEHGEKTVDTDADAYEIDFDITVRNVGERQETLTYTLQGPVGLPLENTENTSKYRDVRVAFLTSETALDKETETAGALVKAEDNQRPVIWKQPIRYIGVDVQYFAALLVPRQNQFADPYLSELRPEVIERGVKKEHSDISVRMISAPLELAPGSSVTHEYLLFTGPKREALLAEFEAESIVDFGWFSPVSRLMLWLLKGLHSLGVPYGIAIILLTVMVRGSMFPLSKAQTRNVQKMKEIQPKLQELRKKHGNNKEEFARAQMKLFSEHNYNVFSGCLPIIVQMPIFLGLYRALYGSVDLRRAEFLWIDNLAGPDALFALPFVVPWFGWNQFNLLPIITVALFIVQQKMYMPPPADEEQALQQKMMMFMTVFIGVMFYQVAAGLCVYFIASSIWGLVERKLLEWWMKTHPSDPSEPVAKQQPDEPNAPEGSSLKGVWKRMQEAADQASGRPSPRPGNRQTSSKSKSKSKPKK